MGQIMEMIDFVHQGSSAYVDTRMVLWQLNNTVLVLVLDNDYEVFASLPSTQNFSVST